MALRPAGRRSWGAPRRVMVGAMVVVALFLGDGTWSTARVVSLAGEADSVLRLFVEAEGFDGLLRRPFWDEDAPGWYALESITYLKGTRRGYVACVHQGRRKLTMTKMLAKPLPPGEYKLFLKVFRCRWREADNIVRVRLGREQHDYRWSETGGWIGPKTFKVPRATNTLRITAVQFGGASFGLLQESKEKVILIDTLYLTGALDEVPSADGKTFVQKKASRRTLPSRGVRLASALASAIWQFVCPSTAWGAEAATPSRRNLLHNSSFELGVNDGWACYCSARDGYILSEKNLDATTAAHGRRSLGLPKGVRPFSKLLSLKSGGQMTFSAHFKAAAPGRVTLSLNRPGKGRPESVAKKTLDVGKRWQRFTVGATVEPGIYFVSVSAESGAAFWLDALQLEYGPMSAYEPRRQVAGAITSGRYGNILYDDETSLLLRFHNSGAATADASLRYRVVDVWESVVAEGRTPVEGVPANATIEKRIDLGLRRRGVFSLIYSIDDLAQPDGETVFCVLPRPDGKRHRHELAANMDFAPHVMAAMRRAGFQWQLYCKIHFTYLRRCQPEPGQFNWDDPAMSMAAGFGFDIVPCLFPSRPPEWMDDRDYAVGKQRRFTRHSEVGYPQLDLYADHVEQVVSHYKGWVKHWWMEDEVEAFLAPRDYARLLRAAIPAVKEADPEAKVGISATPDYIEELLEHIGPDQIDIFGGSTYGGGGWMGRKVRHLCERYGKRWFIIGVGRDKQPSFWHTAPGYRPRQALGGAMGTAQHMVNMTLVQDAAVIGHYTGRLTNYGQHQALDFPLMDYDGTLLPHGVTYTCLTSLLADAEPLGHVELEALDATAHLFSLHGRIGAALWGNRRDVRLPFAKAEVEGLDMYFNPLQDASFDGGGMKFDLTGAPVFLLAHGLTRPMLIERLQAAVSEDRPQLGLSIRFTTKPGEGLAVGIGVGNRTSAPVSDVRVKLTQRRTYGVHPAWFLEEREVAVDRLGPQAERIAELPIDQEALINPIENVLLRADASGRGLRGRLTDALWLLPAPRVRQRPRIDGDLSEWTTRSPAWISVCWGWSRIGRGSEQIESGGEFVSYAGSGDCGVAFWSGWDDRHLYLAFSVSDDDLRLIGEQRDRIEVQLGREPAGQTAALVLACREDGSAEGVLRINGTRHPSAVAGRVRPPERIDGRSGRHGGYDLEAAIPLSALGPGRPRALALMQFDVRQVDVDDEGVGLRQAVLRWAARRRDAGQLVLLGALRPSPMAPIGLRTRRVLGTPYELRATPPSVEHFASTPVTVLQRPGR